VQGTVVSQTCKVITSGAMIAAHIVGLTDDQIGQELKLS
jgi:hypothetical protein